MTKPIVPVATDITPDTPLRLTVAARLAFPDGTMSVSGLRRERDRGRLAIEKIAGKEYTTLAAIEDMRLRCRVPAKESTCGSAQKTGIQTERSGAAPRGSSEMDPGKLAQAALQLKLEKRKAALRNTSKSGTGQTGKENVVLLRS